MSDRFSCGESVMWAASREAAASSAEGVFADKGRRCQRRGELAASTGGASSSTTCALVPPMPKELTPARLGMPGVSQERNLALTKNGLESNSILGFGF